MTAGLPIRPAPAACRISTASPILLHPSLITVFRMVPTLVSHENDSQYQVCRNGSGTKHLVFIAGHPSKYWPRSLVLNQPTVPVLQPPLQLSSLETVLSYNGNTYSGKMVFLFRTRPQTDIHWLFYCVSVNLVLQQNGECCVRIMFQGRPQIITSHRCCGM